MCNNSAVNKSQKWLKSGLGWRSDSGPQKASWIPFTSLLCDHPPVRGCKLTGIIMMRDSNGGGVGFSLEFLKLGGPAGQHLVSQPAASGQAAEPLWEDRVEMMVSQPSKAHERMDP